MKGTYTPGKIQLLYLDSLRALAAIFVVAHHALLQIDFGDYHLNTAQKLLLGMFQNGHYPVNFFIVLSGYCLMLPVIRSNYTLPGGVLQFFQKRARRILPPYYLAMALSLLLISFLIGEETGTHWDKSIPVNQLDLVTHLLLIQDVLTSTGGKINHAFWSISVEWRIYFTFPLILFLWRKTSPGRAILVVATTVIFLLAALKYMHQVYPLVNNTPGGIVPHYLLLFTLGMLGADISFSKTGFFSRWKIGHWTSGLVLSTVVLFALSTAREHYIPSIPWQLLDVAAGVWGVCLLILCDMVRRTENGRYTGMKTILNWKPLVSIGKFGYSLYLIHAPLLQILWQYVLVPLHLSPFMNFVVLSSAGLLVILAVSYVFFVLCEKPFMTKRQPVVAPIPVLQHAV